LLEEALAKLHPDMSREQIHTVVQEVISETRHVMSSGKLLTQRLNSAAVEIEEFKNNVDDLKKQAKVDRLTNLDNRHSFDETIIKIIREADHTLEPVSLIFCDLDAFKTLNEKHGNLVGDQVLKIVAATLKAAVKGRDFVSRYGGKEFTITLVNTNIDDARRIAESIRNEIASKRIQRKDTKEPLGQITMSFGVANYFPSEGVESFLQRADRALYQSKRNGRNKVSQALPPII
jgi:diguanylate cyclase